MSSESCQCSPLQSIPTARLLLSESQPLRPTMPLSIGISIRRFDQPERVSVRFSPVKSRKPDANALRLIPALVDFINQPPLFVTYVWKEPQTASIRCLPARASTLRATESKHKQNLSNVLWKCRQLFKTVL